MMASQTPLTDDDILDYVFNPDAGSPYKAPPESITDDELRKEAGTTKVARVDNVDEELSTSLRQREVKAVALAEDKQLQQSVSALSDIIKSAPTYAAAYNNRAQVYQLVGETERAIEDASHAIRLASSYKHVDRATLTQAYTQRGLLQKLKKNDDAALHDFNIAAKLGSSFARTQATQMNPYAALCNAFLSEAMEKMKKPSSSCVPNNQTPPSLPDSSK